MAVPARYGALPPVRRVPLDSLHPDPANARRHSERNLRAIADSLRAFGQVEPLVVQLGTGKVIGGNGRLEVLRASGSVEVDVVEVDLDDANARALGIMLNQSAALGEWNQEVLIAALQSLPTELRLGAGFEAADLERLLGEFSVGEVAPPEMASGDRSPIQQMTFTLHDDQAEVVKRAIGAAKDAGPFVDTGNENGNGNALARIAEAYIGAG